MLSAAVGPPPTRGVAPRSAAVAGMSVVLFTINTKNIFSARLYRLRLSQRQVRLDGVGVLLLLSCTEVSHAFEACVRQ